MHSCVSGTGLIHPRAHTWLLLSLKARLMFFYIYYEFLLLGIHTMPRIDLINPTPLEGFKLLLFFLLISSCWHNLMFVMQALFFCYRIQKQESLYSACSALKLEFFYAGFVKIIHNLCILLHQLTLSLSLQRTTESIQ